MGKLVIFLHQSIPPVSIMRLTVFRDSCTRPRIYQQLNLDEIWIDILSKLDTEIYFILFARANKSRFLALTDFYGVLKNSFCLFRFFFSLYDTQTHIHSGSKQIIIWCLVPIIMIYCDFPSKCQYLNHCTSIVLYARLYLIMMQSKQYF